MTTPVNRLPDDVLAQFDPPEAKNLIPQARDPNRRWYGVYANYNSPAYNTNFVKREQLPKTYEDFLSARNGRQDRDRQRRHRMADGDLHAITAKKAAASWCRTSSPTLKPVVTEGHLALARSVGAGEYWLALNNYTNLTVNVKLAGAPTDFWAMDPVALIFGSVGVTPRRRTRRRRGCSPNYMLSQRRRRRSADQERPHCRRGPIRRATRRTSARRCMKQKIITAVLSAAEQKKWAASRHSVQEEVGGTGRRLAAAAADRSACLTITLRAVSRSTPWRSSGPASAMIASTSCLIFRLL